MTIKPYEEELLQYYEYRAHKNLLLYMAPILLVLGTLGNLLSFCVLMRRTMRKTSTYNYLAVLSLTDMLVLYIGLLRLWLGGLTGYDIRDQSDWSCKIISMLGYTVSVYSVWLLIAVTVERYIVIVHSLHAPTMCTRRRALKIILGILFLLLSLNIHFLITTQIRYYDGPTEGVQIPECDCAIGYEHLVMDVWPWIDACLYSFLPFIIIGILNVLIIHKVIEARKNRQSMSIRSMHSARNGSQNGVHGRGGHHHGEHSIRLTIMLLTISFTFLITTLPMNITLIIQAFADSYDIGPTLEQASKFRLAHTISELLMYTNHSINFYLYLLTGHKFRKELANMFCAHVPMRWNVLYTHMHYTESMRNGTAIPETNSRQIKQKDAKGLNTVEEHGGDENGAITLIPNT